MDGRYTICIVDNDMSSNRETAAALEEHGYRAVSAASGRECLQQLAGGEGFDLVLLDVDLGGAELDGPGTAAQIDAHYRLPVVFLIAQGDEAALARAEKVNNYGYVQKAQGSSRFLLATVRLALKLHAAEQQRRRSEERFRRIFEYTPVAIWEEDITELKAELEHLRQRGISDLRSYLDRQPEEIDRLAALVRIVDVNEVTVEMLGAADKQEVLTSLGRFILPDTRNILREELLALWEGRTTVERQSRNRTLDGRVLDLLIMISNPPNEEQANRLLVSTIDITERNRLEQQLQESHDRLQKMLQEKEFLLREIHHRVKNNLNMVASLISLKSDRSGGENCQDIHQQITAIMTLHEMLYQSEGMTAVDLGRYLGDLLQSLFDSLTDHQVELQTELEETEVSPDTAVPLALAANEIATNAIKHAFRPEEPARFRLHMERLEGEDRLRLTLANSGAPFPEEIDFPHPETLGLRLIDSLAAQLNGEVELQRGEETRFIITIPLPEGEKRGGDSGE